MCQCRQSRYHPRSLVLLVAALAGILLTGGPGGGAAAASPILQRCAVAAEPGLAAAATRAGLGCPNGPAFTSGASEQPFEAGAMLWLEEWGLVLVLTQDGTYRAYEDFFEEGEAEPAPLRPPGTGLEEPRRGFGKVWRRIGGPDAAVGWAVGPEQGSPAEVQYFERGAVLRLGGRILGLAIFSHSSGTWSTGPRSELTLGLLGALSGRPEFAR